MLGSCFGVSWCVLVCSGVSWCGPGVILVYSVALFASICVISYLERTLGPPVRLVPRSSLFNVICWGFKEKGDPLRPSETNGTGGSAARTLKSTKKQAKAHQGPPGVSRTHPGSIRDAPGARRTTFHKVSQGHKDYQGRTKTHKEIP